MATKLELPKFQAFDVNGDPLVGGLLYTYVVGTSTPKNAYTSAGAGTPWSNPIILNARGEAANDIYGIGYYKLVLKTSADVEIYTIPSVAGVNESSFTTIGDYAGDFDAAITAIGATETTLYIDDTATMSTTVTVPSTCSVVLQKGGSIDQAGNALTFNGPLECAGGTITNDATLTMNGPVSYDGGYVVFSSTSYGTFGTNAIKDIYPEMWGENTVQGTTDMAAEVQAAIDSAGSGTRVIISTLMGLGSGGWTGILVDSVNNVTIEGSRPGAGFKCLSAPSQTMTGYSYAIMLKFDTVNKLQIRNLTIDGNDIATNLIGLDTVTNSIIEDNFLSNTNELTNHSAIYGQTGSGNTIRNNDISNVAYGIHLGNTNADSDKESYTKVLGNYLHDVAFTSITGHYTFSEISQNIVMDSGYSGIAVGSGLTNTAAHIVISNNIVHGCGWQGIQGDPQSGIVMTDIVVSDNDISESGYSGIYFISASDMVISNNICRDNNYGAGGANNSGITAGEAAHNVKIIGNICYDSRASGSQEQAHGIYLVSSTGAGTVHNIDVTNNRCYNNDKDGIRVANSGDGDFSDINVSLNTCIDNAERGINFTLVATDDLSTFFMKDNFVRNNTTEDYRMNNTGYHVNSRVETAASPTLNYPEATVIDSSSNAVDCTLGDGLYVGQRKTIVMQEASNSSTVTVTNHETSDPEVFTFAQVDDALSLEWTGTEWVTINNSGAAT